MFTLSWNVFRDDKSLLLLWCNYTFLRELREVIKNTSATFTYVLIKRKQNTEQIRTSCDTYVIQYGNGIMHMINNTETELHTNINICIHVYITSPATTKSCSNFFPVWNLVLGFMASMLSHKIHVSTYTVNYNFHPHFSLVETIL